MLNAGFQYLEQRDANDTITKDGVVGKNSPFATSDNSGIYDVIAEDLRWLKENIDDVKDTSDLIAIKQSVTDMYNTMKNDSSFGEATAKAQAEEAKKQAQAALESATNAKTYYDDITAKSTEVNDTIAEIKSYIEKAEALNASNKELETSISDSATVATNKANSASDSATKAATSETNAKTSETNAKTSETNAKVSETNASTSAVNAATSASNAKVSETNAKTSETNASASKTDAATSETNAKSYMATAKEYMQKAQEALAAAQAIQSLIDTSKANAEKCLADVEAVKESLAKMITYQGSVDNYSDLPTSPQVGYSYNVKNADKTHGVNAGDNLVWNGTDWDNFGSYVDMSLFAELGKDVKFNTVTATLNGNADTASKLSTARKINITGDASGNATFDGTGDISINTTVNESKHAAAADTLKSSAATETSTVARPVWLSWEGDNTKQTVSPNLTYTCATKTLTTANFKGHLAGNADTADSLNEILDRPASANVTYNDGKIRYFLATNNMSEGKPSGGEGPVMHLSWDNSGWETQMTINSPSGHIQTRAQDNGTWGSWKTVLDSKNYNNFAPTKTGSGASGTWPISISGNADKLDGYHASDLFRHLGGNQTPVITDIFDRAGTIDMLIIRNGSPATHKSNINKAQNASQRLWNTKTGIHAYDGSYNVSGGYSQGTLKLTQSYKNFDKILIVGCDLNGERIVHRTWDVWDLANAFANSYCFSLFSSGAIDNSGGWLLFGSARQGADTSYALSTDTIWSCNYSYYDSDSDSPGIVAIYGIKY